MPVKSPKQWGFMGAARSGHLKSAGGPSPEVAKEFMDKTPDNKRKKFTEVLKKKAKKIPMPKNMDHFPKMLNA